MPRTLELQTGPDANALKVVGVAIVRDVHKIPTKQKLIRSMVDLCRDMGILLVAEGVESREELDVLAELGCDLFQGYHLAKPGKPFPEVRFD